MKADSPHPYFIYPALAELRGRRGEPADQRLAELKRQVALNAPDRAAASLYADLHGDDWASIYPRPQDTPVTTDNAIDIFMETYGRQSAEETALLERLIFNPMPEYSEVLEKEEKEHPAPAGDGDEQDALIAAFINGASPAPVREAVKPETQPEPAPVPAAEAAPAPKAPEAPASSTLSEALAKIFIKQGRYERAYEIISDLNLNFPEKSVYFADQLRFLQKLIKIKEGRGGARL